MRDWLRNFRKRNPDYYPNWFRSNADSKRVASRRWYLKNAERSIAYTLNWRKSNMARFKSTRIEYVKNNSELIRAYSSNRRALKKASGSHTAQDIRALLEKQKFLCVGCSVSVKSKYHVDHKKPLSRGGSNRAFNLQILCPSCNLRKRDKDFTVWAREVGLRT
jgi:5-methylcytosine-specific restriction endonuclease McrA